MKLLRGLDNLISKILEVPFFYSVWSKNLTAQKISFLTKMLPATKGLSVLDVGCGPGSNTHLFSPFEYTGVDINPEYIKVAQKQFPDCKFLIQDAQALDFPEYSFDLVVANSFFHHLSDSDSHKIFEKLRGILKHDGTLILSEPLIPEENKVLPYILMKLDRGKFFRTYDQYCKTFQGFFDIDQAARYSLKIVGSVTGWTMLLFKLKRRG